MSDVSLEDIEDVFRQHGVTTPEFTLNGLRTYARVVSVYDGDTMKCIIPVFNTFFKFNVRLSGIDTCEMKSKKTEAKVLAIRARDRLINLVTGGKTNISMTEKTETKKDITNILENDVFLVWLHCLELDKYGRTICNIYASPNSNVSFSDILIEEHLAYVYEGETKLSEEEQVKLLWK